MTSVQHQQAIANAVGQHTGQYVQQSCTAHQVQAATQTPQPTQQISHVVPPNVPPPEKKSGKSEGGGKSKKRLQTSRQHATGHHHSSRQQDNGQFFHLIFITICFLFFCGMSKLSGLASVK